MKKSWIAVVALGALVLAPAVASAGGRFGTDRGGRYSGYHGGGGRGYSGSRSHFDISIGFGSGGYHRGGYSYSSFRYSTGRPYYRDYYRPRPVVVYSPPVVACPPPVVYVAPPVVYSPAPVVYYPAPRVYAAPAYPTSYYYSSGGYYCGR